MSGEELSPAQRERLVFLIENAAEIQKSAARVLRFGWSTMEREDLEKSLSQLHFASLLITWANEISRDKILKGIDKLVNHPPISLIHNVKKEFKNEGANDKV